MQGEGSHTEVTLTSLAANSHSWPPLVGFILSSLLFFINFMICFEFYDEVFPNDEDDFAPFAPILLLIISSTNIITIIIIVNNITKNVILIVISNNIVVIKIFINIVKIVIIIVMILMKVTFDNSPAASSSLDSSSPAWLSSSLPIGQS